MSASLHLRFCRDACSRCAVRLHVTDDMAFARKFKGHIHNINHHCHSDASFKLRYFVHASRNSDAARTAALISLCGNNLIVERAQLKAKFAPGIEMVGSGDSPSNTLACTDRPVLLKGRCSDN